MVNDKYQECIRKRHCNKVELMKVEYCDCDNCGTLFLSKLITKCIEDRDNNHTFKCPFCYYDDILPLDNDYDKSVNLLKEIMAFSRSVNKKDVIANPYSTIENSSLNLKIKILKGTNQIGGCITEIKSDKARIIIDFGEDLENGEKEASKNIKIDGLTYGKPKYDAVFITHSHADHIGLINYILPEIPVYVEEKSYQIYKLLCDFTNKEYRENVNKVYFNNWYNEYEYIPVKDMKIKYFKVDHSAYNSSMILIEYQNKKVLHTGDFRNHGYKGKKFLETLKQIGKIDCLITEGTCFSRENVKYQTEQELSDKATELFKKYNQVFILQSSTNIDRITSFFKASVKTGKKFIEDVFTANITLNLDKNIPNPNFDNNKVSVWIPKSYNKKSNEFKEKYIIPLEKYKHVENVYKDYTMLVKTSMYDDIKMLYEKGKVTNACLVYSMWNGYLDNLEMKTFIEGVKSLGIDFVELHTSGHADLETIKSVENVLRPDKVIAIHTTKNKIGDKIFKGYQEVQDNVEVEV